MRKKVLHRSAIAVFIGLFVGILDAAASGTVLEGTVKDATGHAINEAVVRIEGKHFTMTTKTDARGHYLAKGLAAASYKVTLIVNGQIKASILDAKTQDAKPTELNFDIKQEKKKTHRVWVSAPTGTHIGPTGYWIDVDEHGVPVNDSDRAKVGTNPIDAASGAALQGPNAIRAATKPGP